MLNTGLGAARGKLLERSMTTRKPSRLPGAKQNHPTRRGEASTKSWKNRLAKGPPQGGEGFGGTRQRKREKKPTAKVYPTLTMGGKT